MVLFSGDLERCKDINECDGDSPCNKNENCENTVGSFKCSCKAPLWVSDGLQCRPTYENLCWRNLDSCDKDTEDCVTLQNSTKCDCKGRLRLGSALK